MTYEVFEQELLESLQARAGRGQSFHCRSIVKNNGVELPALVLEDSRTHLSPCIYTEGLYDRFRRGLSLAEITERIWESLEKESRNDADLSCFMDYGEVRDHLFCKAVSAERNRTMLEQCPHECWEDLAITVYFEWQDEHLPGASVHVRNEHMEIWKVSQEELLKTAWKNTLCRKPARLRPLDEVLLELSGWKGENHKLTRTPLYHLSNEENDRGGICFLYPGLAEKIGRELDSDYYVLPSSIHESIVLAEQMDIDVEELAEMVFVINRQEVAPEEVLSDSVYYYDRREKKLFLRKSADGREKAE